MKLRTGTVLAGVIVAGLGIASIATNPNETDYYNYATIKLTQYLQERECPQASATVKDLCGLLDNSSVQGQIKHIIENNTDRQNWVVFSIYKTDLNAKQLLPGFLSNFVRLPSYHFETVAGFNNFQTYKAEKTSSK